ncbi:MAG: DUF3418 domain-containing protein, partial [Acidobacteria bacterium]|nr:DUF3418 domain-containing protein [Acidobacteriota bacterium]
MRPQSLEKTSYADDVTIRPEEPKPRVSRCASPSLELLQDRVLALIKSLPKRLRRNLSPAPDAADTFHRSKRDLAEREAHAEAGALHRDLLKLRRTDPVIAAAGTRRVDGALLATEA